jgi:hypothetical protein
VFDPRRVAELELGMWQAYYQKENLRLFALLVVMLREQYRYTWARAATAGFLSRAARRAFRGNEAGLRDGPSRSAACVHHRQGLDGGHYDPAAVARAELAWWVARRDPRMSSVDNVGRLISELYAVFYEGPAGRVAEAGRLRARAAALRDKGGDQPDWQTIRALLGRSYAILHGALQS